MTEIELIKATITDLAEYKKSLHERLLDLHGSPENSLRANMIPILEAKIIKVFAHQCLWEDKLND